ncbi:MFS transporter [Saccharospirillum mangrovi]|uniref:MFS transporter n=1 Tax=Saccharospirillum mangrovi TaxID=2161747 RepID=UPI0013009A1D|nr:MFS transporter [Saccharospirillum mangrovi]
MSAIPRNLWVLIATQAFSMSAVPMVVLIGGLVGAQLAPDPQLATLPVAVLILATALSTLPASLLMRKVGRRLGFLTGNAVSITGCLLGFVALNQASFPLFLITSACLGFNMACINQYRFAAMESVTAERQGQAISWLLLGGIFAAIVGPEAGARGEMLTAVPYAGSFLLLAALQLVSTALLVFGFRDPVMVTADAATDGRSWPELLAQPMLWLALLSAATAFSVMSLVMTAAPISMHEFDHHSLALTKSTIQAHILAMFLPSLATATLIRRFGPTALMVTGLLIYAGMVIAGLTGRSLGHYGLSLVLLGIGWNFLFVAGTALLPLSYVGNERFRVQAVNDFLVFGAQAVASLGAGWLLFQVGWNALLWVTVPMMLVLAVLALWVMGRPRPTQTA